MEQELRTVGDGIDNNSLLNEELIVRLNISNEISINKDSYSSILESSKPVELKSCLINLVPKYVPRERKVPKYLIRKPKEPKFVPYEPYKAAVKPMASSGLNTKVVCVTKSSKNDIEIHELVNQVSEMRKIEINELNANVIEEKYDETFKVRLQWEKQKQEFEIDIKNLRETNSHLENQLKFQAQVNSELKTLLVAAVGEDLESRVQHLTEDKLALARALLNSANHLTSHQEQSEWLSGQCEVWRSKFLASSLMVEELAKWKSALTNRINELQEVTKTLLGEHRKVHSVMLKTFNSLKSLMKKVYIHDNNDQIILKYGNIIEVANANQELIESIKKNMDLKGEETKTVDNLMQPTLTEKTAEKMLQNPVTISTKQDILCKAVMGAAISLGGSQMFLQYPSLHSCCSHCKGEIQNI